MNKKALIFGITGQDGYYLSKLLISKGYDVYGVIRRHSNHGTEMGLVSQMSGSIQFEYGDLTDPVSVDAIIHKIVPDETYNLAAQSHVQVSFDVPGYTGLVNAMGAMNVMESLRKFAPNSKFYQASTSEMFGNFVDEDGFQREDTPMRPVSPYGVAKLFAHQMVSIYRKQYGLFACSGILFNHESPKRGDNFVTKKIINYIRKGDFSQKLELGNLDARRDWGHAEDYVYGMWLMLQQDIATDYVLATGVTHSIKDFLELSFGKKGLNWKEHVVSVDRFQRPEDVHHLKGDATKARNVLGWSPNHNLQSLIDDMMEN
jgi:GDPmannose 4,6-dehydratase